MNQDKFKGYISFQGHTYPFDFGSQAYIFHTGVLNDFYENHGIDALLQYVSFVHDCYMHDDNRTPLGALADYIAECWDSIRNCSKYEILRDFYNYF